MFKIKNHEIVFFYDQPQVIISRDDQSRPCISLLVNDQDDWLVCQVTPDDFRAFCSEGKDLLSVMQNPKTTFGMFNEAVISEDAEYEVKAVPSSELKPEWFPGPGFKLNIKAEK